MEDPKYLDGHNPDGHWLVGVLLLIALFVLTVVRW